MVGVTGSQGGWGRRGISRRSFLKLGATAALVGATGGSLVGTAEAAGEVVFAGTQVANVQSIDPLSGQSLGIQSFQIPAIVVVSPRISGGGLTESNPFNLVASATDKSAAGAVDVWSAAVANVPANIDVPNPNPGPVLLQYWEIQSDQTGAQFAGQLTNSHTAEAAALNLINAPTQIAPGVPPIPFPRAIVEGSTLQGQSDGTSIRIVIQGNTVDGFTPFTSQVDAVLQ